MDPSKRTRCIGIGGNEENSMKNQKCTARVEVTEVTKRQRRACHQVPCPCCATPPEKRMACAVVFCCLLIVLAWVVWRVQAHDVCQEYNLGAFAAMLVQMKMKFEIQEKKIADIEAMGKVEVQETKIQALQNESQAQKTKIQALQNESQALQNESQALQNESQALQNESQAQKTKIATLEKALEKTNDAVGFTVTGIKEISSSGVMTFFFVITNTDNSYNQTTGVFTCKTPGFYYFATSLVKSSSHTGIAGCYIYKNGDIIVRAYTNPDSSAMEGETPAVNGGYVHLNTGDTVTLRRCTESSSWYMDSSRSSFTGFLIKADVA